MTFLVHATRSAVPAGCATSIRPQSLRNALNHNNRNRDGTFTDSMEKAGVLGGGYGIRVAVGDFNADGFPDLFLFWGLPRRCRRADWRWATSITMVRSKY